MSTARSCAICWRNSLSFEIPLSPNDETSRFESRRRVTSLPALPKLGHGPPANEFRLGANQVTIGVRHRRPYKPGADIQIEKVEVAVKYRQG